MAKKKSKILTKEDIKKLIDKHDSFVIIFNEDKGNEVSSYRYNICRGEEIVALEIVKHNTIYEVLS